MVVAAASRRAWVSIGRSSTVKTYEKLNLPHQLNRTEPSELFGT
jgi:hypothetical protein